MRKEKFKRSLLFPTYFMHKEKNRTEIEKNIKKVSFGQHFAFPLRSLRSLRLNRGFEKHGGSKNNSLTFHLSPLTSLQSILIHQVNKRRNIHRTQFQFPLIYIFKNIIARMMVIEITLGVGH
jgi:hypothetical protein